MKADARYIRHLPNRDLRRAELQRLARVWGDGYRWNVERALKEGRDMDEGCPVPEVAQGNPRVAALRAAMAGEKG